MSRCPGRRAYRTGVIGAVVIAGFGAASASARADTPRPGADGTIADSVTVAVNPTTADQPATYSISFTTAASGDQSAVFVVAPAGTQFPVNTPSDYTLSDATTSYPISSADVTGTGGTNVTVALAGGASFPSSDQVTLTVGDVTNPGPGSYQLQVYDDLGDPAVDSDTYTITGTYQQSVLADNPSVYYRLGETPSATVAADSSGNGVDGSYAAAATLGVDGAIAGSSDTAASTDGTGPIATASDSSLPAGSSARTVEGWIRIPNGSDGSAVLADYGSGAAAAGDDVELAVTAPLSGDHSNDAGYLIEDNFNDGGVGWHTPYGLADGSWHLIDLVMDGSGSDDLYLDGVSLGTRADTTTSTVLAGTGGLKIGDGFDLHGSADVDEVAIYPTALTATQVAEHESLGSTTKTWDAYGDFSTSTNPVADRYGDASTWSYVSAPWNGSGLDGIPADASGLALLADSGSCSSPPVQFWTSGCGDGVGANTSDSAVGTSASASLDSGDVGWYPGDSTWTGFDWTSPRTGVVAVAARLKAADSGDRAWALLYQPQGSDGLAMLDHGDLSGTGSTAKNRNGSVVEVHAGDSLLLLVGPGGGNSGNWSYDSTEGSFTIASTSALPSPTVTVPDTASPTATGLWLNAGDTVSLAATGATTCDNGADCESGPDGVYTGHFFDTGCGDGTDRDCPDEDARTGSLVYAVSGTVPASSGSFSYAGAANTITASNAGELYLMVNDGGLTSGGYGDNSGSYTATLTSDPTGPAVDPRLLEVPAASGTPVHTGIYLTAGQTVYLRATGTANCNTDDGTACASGPEGLTSGQALYSDGGCAAATGDGCYDDTAQVGALLFGVGVDSATHNAFDAVFPAGTDAASTSGTPTVAVTAPETVVGSAELVLMDNDVVGSGGNGGWYTVAVSASRQIDSVVEVLADSATGIDTGLDVASTDNDRIATNGVSTCAANDNADGCLSDAGGVTSGTFYSVAGCSGYAVGSGGECTADSAQIGSLVYDVGDPDGNYDNTFSGLGAGGAISSGAGGELYVMSNDATGSYDDNSGMYAVAVIGSAPSQTATTTSISPSANPADVDATVTYTATVSPTPDGGTVAFADSNGRISGCDAQAVNATTGEATCSTSYSSAGSQSVTATYSGDASFAGSASDPLDEQIDQRSQTITFVDPSGVTYGQTPRSFGPGATADSGLAVSYTGGSAGVCSVSEDGTQVHIDGAGSCTVTATQAGDAEYAAASSVQRTFSIAIAPLTITALNASMTQGGALPTVMPSYSGFVYDDNATSLSTAPTCTADPDTSTTSCRGAVDPNYDITYVAGTLTVNAPAKSDQTVSFTAPSGLTYGDSDTTLAASASSGLPVSFSGGTAGVCTVSGSGTLHILGAGTCSVTAGQAGNDAYNAAPDVTRAVVIAKAAQRITLQVPKKVTYADSRVAVRGTSSSGLPVKLTPTSERNCQVIAAGFNVRHAGGCALTARQAGNHDFLPAATTQTVKIQPATLRVVASDAQMVRGGDKPTVNPIYRGFVHGDDASALKKHPHCHAVVKKVKTVCTGGQSKDYRFDFHAGSLTFSKTGYAITSASYAAGVAGKRFHLAISVDGAPAAKIIVKGNLPPGLALDQNAAGTTATIAGSPTSAHTRKITVTAKVKGKVVARQTLLIVIS